MTALVRDLPRAQAHREAMARDLLGFAALAAPAAAYHTALSARDTGGALSVADATWAAGAGAATHAHGGEDELLVVLAGEVELAVAGRRFRLAAGERAFVPRATPHGFVAVTEARVLAILSRERLDAPLTERLRPARLAAV